MIAPIIIDLNFNLFRRGRVKLPMFQVKLDGNSIQHKRIVLIMYFSAMSDHTQTRITDFNWPQFFVNTTVLPLSDWAFSLTTFSQDCSDV